MMGVIAAEWLKYRRTFTRTLLVLQALVPVVFSYIQNHLAADWGASWDHTIKTVFNWWPVLFLPTGAALLAALAAYREQRTGAWRVLRTRAVSPAALFLGKFAVLALHTLVGTVLLLLGMLVLGLVVGMGPVPWATLLKAAALSWLTTLPILAILLWAALAGGSAAAMGLGGAGLLAGVIAAANRAWVYLPWAWPVRVMSPVIGVHPNGVPLEAGDPLLDAGVIRTAIVLAPLATAVVLALAALWFQRKEVQ